MAIDDTENKLEFISGSVKSIFDETADIKLSSKKHFEELEKNSKSLDESVKKFNVGLISTKQFVEDCMNCLKEVRNIVLDIKNTTRAHQLDKAFEERLIKAIEVHGSTISPDTLEDIKKILSNYDVNNIKNSVRDEERGKDPIFKNTDNSKVQSIYKDLLNTLGVKVDTLGGKILTLMADLFEKNGKRNKGFVKDILDGMASSKFIGGAFKDILKLLGLMAGSWIKSHVGGPMGGWLAAAAFLLIPIIVPAVLKFLMRSGLEKLGGAIVGSVLGKGASAALGASKVASTVSGAVGEGITEGGKALHVAEAAKLGQGSGGMLGKDGLIRGLGSRPLESTEKAAQALSQSTSKLSKIVQPLSKLLDNPVMKFAGKAAPYIGYGYSAYEGYKGIKDWQQGNIQGAGWRGTAAITGAAATASWGIAAALAPETMGASFLAPLLLTVTSWYSSWQAQQSESNYQKFTSSDFPGSSWNSRGGSASSVSGAGNNLQVSGSESSKKTPSSQLSLVKVLGTDTKLSTEGRRFIANQEGRYEYTYDDHGAWGKNGRRVRFMPGDIRNGTLTAGIGHTGKDVVAGGTYSNEKIESWFKSDLKLAKNRVDYSVRKFAPNLAVPQDIYDMMIDSSFQAGYSPLEVVNRTKGLTGKPTALMKALMAEDWEKARKLMTNGSYGNKNRAIRRKTFFKDANILPPPPTAETSQVEPPKEPKKEPEKKPEKTPEVKVETLEPQKKSEGDKNTGTNLVNAISTAAGVDVPGNDTTFKVLKDFNNISIFGGD